MDMGKSLGDRVDQLVWASLCCDHLSLFGKISPATEISHEEGVSPPNVVEILQLIKKLTLYLENKVGDNVFVRMCE